MKVVSHCAPRVRALRTFEGPPRPLLAGLWLLAALALGSHGDLLHAQAVSHVATKPALTGAAAASPSAAAGRPSFVPGHILVAKKRGSADSDFHDALRANNGNALGRLGNLDVHVVNVPAGRETEVVERLSRNPHIEFAELDEAVAPDAGVNDPDASLEWHLGVIGAPAAWDLSVGSGVTIAILDTGVDPTHPDLVQVPGWNFYDNNSNSADVYGHGTAVAGAAAAAMNNGIGVAGVAGSARIMPIRISDPAGYGYFSTIAQGLSWAADRGARVANISYSVAGSSTVINAANYFRSKGGLVAVSAGNTGANDSTPPTSSMLVVAATDASDQRAGFSTYGSFIGIAAPGVSIYTTANGGGYRYASGTSFSSPVVAGAAALVLARRPDYTSAQVEAALKSTATDLGSAGTDVYYGAGRLNAAAAVQLAAGSGTGDSTPPTVAIASPTGGTASGTVAVSVSASDNVGVTRVELRVNGVTVASDSAAPFQFSWNSGSVANGTVSLTAAAFDAAGNSAVSSTVSLGVSNGTPTVPDTTPPTVSITSPSGGAATVSGTVTVSINATDNVGVTRVDLRVNGSTVATGNSAPYQLSWNSTMVPDGSATLSALAYDAAGNSASSAPVAVNVANAAPPPVADTSPPTLAITNPADGSTVSGSVTITTSVGDDSGTAGITQTLYIDGVQKSTVTGRALIYKWNTRPAAAGTHRIRVSATDAAGNTTAREAQVTKSGK
jgi:subtilisin family serine protease